MKATILATIAGIFLVSCTNSGVIPAGPDTYMISAGGVGFSSAGVRAKTYKKAKEFCDQKGLVFVPLSLDAQEGVYGERPPSANLTFRALKPGDPEIKRPTLEKPNHIQRIQVR